MIKKVRRNISISKDADKKAKQLTRKGTNISKVCEDAIVQEHQKKADEKANTGRD